MTAYPCPFCSCEATLTTGCPGCGRGPDPDAAEVVRLDAEIPVLTARLATARQAVGVADAVLRKAWQQREAAAAKVRAAVAGYQHAPATTAPITTAAGEASTRLVQNTLFTLGGVLLAVAAIVFTAVAWSQFGLKGRAGLLGVATVVALVAPLFALRRKLRASAETFAAVGLLLVLLDGYAAWYVNLFGLAHTTALGYAGAVFAVTAAIAAGYEHLTGLTGPRYAALVLAQPVLPLVVAPSHPGTAGWAYTMTLVAAANLMIFRLGRSVRFVAYGFGLAALALAALLSLTGLAVASATGSAALSAFALLAAAAVLAAAHRSWSVALAVIALAIGGGRVAAIASGGFWAPILLALIVTVLAVAATLVPSPVRRAARFGALVSLGVPVVAALTVFAGTVVFGWSDWRLPVVIAVLTVGVAVLRPRVDVVLSGVALTGLAALAAVVGSRVPWPVVAVAAVVTGLGALVLAALLAGNRWAVPAGAGVLTVGPGLAGAAISDTATLVAFGLTVVAGGVAAAQGRVLPVRVAGVVSAVLAAFVEAVVAGRRAGLEWRGIAFVLLGTAAAMLAVGVLVTLRRRGAEGRVLQAAGHGGALLAVLLMGDSGRYMAAVCTFWGVALGLRALVRAAGAWRQHVIAAAVVELAAAWMLLAASDVAVVEAYTIPAAVVALLAGLLLRRGLSSWAAYGPALAAALLPTLMTVLVQEGEPLRRLLLGLAALALTVVGAQMRLRAPVVAGGVTLVVLALHEAILVWDLLPRWIPLAAAGLLLVGLAMTLERRRRDMARLRAALTRMG